ncbi:hypothetical protein OG880_33215 (plasmid) [Streptomyces cellulosae]|uniref:hypothetical protein n=1 Tax=Streptomyces cellulosae TaxID=1968 RepID=UPI002ED257BE|nr:hypothetical protein OG880_33215 [Streptomyces cellulosae]
MAFTFMLSLPQQGSHGLALHVLMHVQGIKQPIKSATVRKLLTGEDAGHRGNRVPNPRRQLMETRLPSYRPQAVQFRQELHRRRFFIVRHSTNLVSA